MSPDRKLLDRRASAMATLMRSSNPALNEKAFKGQVTFGEAMTLQGTVNKTGFLLLCVATTAAWTWGLAHSPAPEAAVPWRSEEHTSELQSHSDLVCRLLLEKKNISSLLLFSPRTR